MKKLLLLSGFFFVISAAYCQTLFTYGNHAVSAKEFLKAYNKNKTPDADSTQAMRDYLDLYTKFKLKVQAAKDLHYDTIPALQADLQNFRSQIEENYLKDEKQVAKLVDEAFARSQKDIHVLHFFIAAEAKDSNKIVSEIYQQLKSGRKSAEQVIADASKESVSVQENDLGFITVFTLPYEYENIIYQLKPGQYSVPYHTKKGWHIFKNIEERHAVGKIKLAQILLAAPPNLDNQKALAKKLADSLYNALKNGSDFGTLAKDFSDDRMTYMNGGMMPEFGTAKYNGVFEKMAFSLREDGRNLPTL